MDALSISSLEESLILDMDWICPASNMKSMKVVKYLHTTEKRGLRPFPLHECLVMIEIASSGKEIFALALYLKSRKGKGWSMAAAECGDRDRPPPAPYQLFPSLPTPDEIKHFIGERDAFHISGDQRVLATAIDESLVGV
jgi:hypothetical protein